ncbi:MAG: hypothetical protein K2G23_04700, partial [Muribaculaceae bacterium]|nr:hypothetical protein [Muribaculaceae bacterium]
MKIKLLSFCTAMAASLLIATRASAQRDSRLEHDVVSLINNDKVSPVEVEESLEENGPESPHDNGLPRFALIGKDGLFYMGIGAQLLGEAMVDWGDRMPSAELFIPSAIEPKIPGDGCAMRFGWQSSAVYLNMVALPETPNQIGLFFKGVFSGQNHTVKVYHFYSKYRGLTAGYTLSSFTDSKALPMTIDFEGPNGYPFKTLFTAYWTRYFGKGFSATLGIDAPQVGMTLDETARKVSQRIPSIPVNLQYAWEGGESHVRLAAIYRPMQYRDNLTQKNKAISGGGIQLSGMAKLTGGLGINYNATYGSGIGSYLLDDEDLSLDAVSCLIPGTVKAVKSMGLTGGLSYLCSSKVSTNVCYSHLTNWLPDDGVLEGTAYRYGDYVAANVIY